MHQLLDNPTSQSKPWANLYAQTLTTYSGIDVKGSLQVNRNISSESCQTNDLQANQVRTQSLAINNGYPITKSFDAKQTLDLVYDDTVVGQTVCHQSLLGNRAMINLDGCQWNHTSAAEHIWDYVNGKHMYSFSFQLCRTVRPSTILVLPIPIMNGGKCQGGKAIINPSGLVDIYASMNEIEFDDGECGLVPTSLSWLV